MKMQIVVFIFCKAVFAKYRERPVVSSGEPLTFHATTILLECVASGALFLRLLAAR